MNRTQFLAYLANIIGEHPSYEKAVQLVNRLWDMDFRGKPPYVSPSPDNIEFMFDGELVHIWTIFNSSRYPTYSLYTKDAELLYEGVLWSINLLSAAANVEND